MQPEILSYEMLGHDAVLQAMVLDADVVAANWQLFYPFLAPLAKTDPVFLLPEDVLPMMRAGRLQFWAGNNATEIFGVVLTSIHTYPRARVCHISWACGHGVIKALPLLETIEAWAQQNECDFVQVEGRIGWLKVLEHVGYKLYGMRLMKPLNRMTEH